MAIDIHEDGDFLQFVCPRLYNLRECPHKAAAFEAALVMAWRTKSVGYEYHPESGELRAVFELPLEDSMLTERQMARIVKTVYDLIETYDPVIRHAMKTGKVDMERTKHAEPDEEAVKNQEVSELIRQLGGLDKLREMASQNRAPGS
ncbi:MAG: hypothetical protein EBU79_06360 [Betaproteobacteria bacterium]|nr:hypothetical protein [Betaproteobacteria bacterium]